MAAIVMDALEVSPEQKIQLHRIADLMLVIYNTMVEMRYLEPEDVEEGPHDVSKLMPLYESLGLDPTVIYLYSILPYVRNYQRAFFQRGDFADFRVESEVETARDPMYAGSFEEGAKWGADNGPYMRPWYTALSHCGNHNCFLVYDTRTDMIAIHSQGDYGCHDPNINQRWTDEDHRDEGVEADNDGSNNVNPANDNESDGEDEQEEDEGDDNSDSGVSGMEDEENDGDHDGDDDDDEEEEEEDDGLIEEEGTIAQVDSRSAAAVLRDINRWYRELQTTFEGEGTPSAWRDDEKDFDITIAALFQRHGWPGADFDGDGFEVDLERREARSMVKFDVEEPRRWLSSMKCDLQRMDWNIQHLQDRLHVAIMGNDEKKKAPDDKSDEEAVWTARWGLFEKGRMRDHLARQLKEAEERDERDFPGGQWRHKQDMSLREYERLREGSEEYQESLKEKNKEEVVEEEVTEKQKAGMKAETKEEQGREESEGQPPLKRQRLTPLRSLPQGARRPALLRRAAEASRVDAVRLCGSARVAESDEKFLMGLTYWKAYDEDMQKLRRESLARFKGDLAAMREWAAADNLPPGMTATRAKVDAAIAHVEEQIKLCHRLIH